MKSIKPLLLIISLAGLLSLSGCIAAIGNDSPPRSSATVGQQLIDLQKARDSGAMTEAEYQTQRGKFLRDR